MADVTVNAAIFANHYLRSTRAGITWLSDQVGYNWFLDSVGDVRYSKTTDGGQTWGAGVQVMAGGGFEGFNSFCIWYDQWTQGDSGTKVHVWASDWNNNRLRYRSADISAGTPTLGTEVTVASVTVDSISSYNDGFVSGTKAKGGNLVVLWRAQSGSAAVVHRSTDAGASWGTARASPMEVNTEDFAMLCPADDADGQDIACIYFDDSANELSFKLYDDSANTWGNETSIDAAYDNTGDFPDPYWGVDVAIRHSDGKAIVAWWNNENASTADLKCATLTLTAAGKNSTTGTAILSNANAAGECGVFIHQATGDIYVCYVKGGTWDSLTDVFYAKSTDSMSSWGSETQYNTTQDDYRRVYSGTSVKSGQSGRFMPSWPDDDDADLFANYDNSVAITAGATEHEADLEETAAISEQVVAALGTAVAPSEEAAIVENLAALVAAIAGVNETGAVVEELGLLWAAQVAPAETVDLVEQLAAAAGGVAGVEEEGEVVEELGAVAGHVAGVAETGAIVEEVAPVAGYQPALSEEAAVVEAILAAWGTAVGLSETGDVVEEVEIAYQARVQAAETAALVEEVEALQSGGTDHTADLEEEVACAEAVVAAVATAVAPSEEAAIVEQLVIAWGAQVGVAEEGTVVEDLAAVAAYKPAPSETCALVEECSAPAGHVCGPTETATVVEDLAVVYHAIVNHVETCGLTEALSAIASGDDPARSRWWLM